MTALLTRLCEAAPDVVRDCIATLCNVDASTIAVHEHTNFGMHSEEKSEGATWRRLRVLTILGRRVLVLADIIFNVRSNSVIPLATELTFPLIPQGSLPWLRDDIALPGTHSFDFESAHLGTNERRVVYRGTQLIIDEVVADAP